MMDIPHFLFERANKLGELFIWDLSCILRKKYKVSENSVCVPM